MWQDSGNKQYMCHTSINDQIWKSISMEWVEIEGKSRICAYLPSFE